MSKQKDQFITQISPATTIKGELLVENDLRIGGRIEGGVLCAQDLILEATGVVIGDIATQSADLAGTLQGNVRVSGKLVLEGTARVEGDIEAKQLVIHDGAYFQGRCQMTTPQAAVE